MQVPGQKEG